MTMTSVDLPPDLVEAAKTATGQTTTRGAITVALELVVGQRRRLEAIDKLAALHEVWQEAAKPEVRAQARR
jgi:hypothetical protein